MKYKRVLLKLSGEALTGSEKFGIGYEASLNIANSLKKLHSDGLQLALVIGGGNIFRGVNLKELGMQRTPADHIGMLSTLINGIALQQALESIGCPARVMTALECPKVAEPFNWTRAQDSLNKGEVLIFVGGTGNPYFTTDTAAALRASEIKADVLVKATKVDGIYDKDPLKFPDAVKYHTMGYSQILAQNLQVMDATSIALCMSNKIPIFVFNMKLLGKVSIDELIAKHEGTLVKESSP